MVISKSKCIHYIYIYMYTTINIFILIIKHAVLCCTLHAKEIYIYITLIF